MIVREKPDGSLLLIAQTDHAKVSGTFAAHWGNDTFARPRPYEPAVRAAIYHDSGWYRYQTSPRIDPATGKIPDFTQVPLDADQLAAFQWGIDWLTEIDPYAGLLVGKHRTGLWRDRYGTIREPAGFTSNRPAPAVEEFTRRNEARQQQQLAAFDEAEFWTNYHLLQVWDLLSLYFCIREPVEQHIDPVPLGYADGAGKGVRMTLRPLDSRRVAIDPYPFAPPSLAFSVIARILPTNRFPDDASFRAAYYQAVPQLLPFELVPA